MNIMLTNRVDRTNGEKSSDIKKNAENIIKKHIK